MHCALCAYGTQGWGGVGGTSGPGVSQCWRLWCVWLQCCGSSMPGCLHPAHHRQPDSSRIGSSLCLMCLMQPCSLRPHLCLPASWRSSSVILAWALPAAAAFSSSLWSFTYSSSMEEVSARGISSWGMTSPSAREQGQGGQVSRAAIATGGCQAGASPHRLQGPAAERAG